MNTYRAHFTWFGLLLLGLVITSCELTTPLSPQLLDEIEDIRFTEHIQPFILEPYCERCHAGADAAAGLQLDSWDNLIAGSDHGEAVIPFDADNSIMAKMVTILESGPHPFELDADTLDGARVRLLQRWINAGARFDGPIDAVNQGVIPFSTSPRLLFVANQDDALISVIDIDAKLVIRTIDLQNDTGFDFSPNAKPHDVEAEPDLSAIYTSLIGENAVVKISIDNLELTGQLMDQAFMETPGMLALNPLSDQLFVGRSLSAVSPPRSIGEITRSTMAIKEIEILSQRPHALAISPSGSFVYTASLNENRIHSVPTDSSEVTFTLLQAPFNAFIHFAISPDGSRLAASGQESNQVMLLDTSAPPGIKRIGGIEVGNQPWHPVWTPDQSYVYVGNLADNSVSVIDANNFIVSQTITGNGLAQPHGSAVSPEGDYVFISNRNVNGAYTPRYNFGTNQNTGTVVVINTATNEIEKVIEVGRYPAGLSTVVE
ncbi:MAG: hypothetical protein KTR29_16960 [Rhodothermaceae bacterium]|nr:hypothetical protein [Rhodothermaceae bacterium]